MIEARKLESTLFGWITANREQFALSHARDAKHALELIKPLGELVLTLDVVRAHGLRTRTRHCEKLFKWAWSEFGNGNLLHDILLARPDLIILTSIYGSFHRNGFRFTDTQNFVGYLQATRFARAVQFPNWRRLDYEHALEILNLGKISKDSIRRMWSSVCPEPWLIEHESAYAFTHELFYVSDFGRNPSRIPKRVRAFAKLWIPAWIEIFLSRNNWDLVAELLMAGSCINCEATHRNVLRQMAEVVSKNGFLPGPAEGGANLKSSSDTPARLQFLTHYHTTLVGWMAIQLFLKRFHRSLQGF